MAILTKVDAKVLATDLVDGIRAQVITELKQRARADGLDFLSSFDAIPTPPSDEYIEIDRWLDLPDSETEGRAW